MKIDIFSGFLGAGKTTLIKKLIKEAYAGEKLVLIENEFGEIGIDGGFMKEAGIEITEMNSGCICCSLVGDFAKALKKVYEQFAPDRIIIEPSGVGKLSDVTKAVLRADLENAEVNACTTVVNAAKCKMYMKNFGEFFNDQVANAGCIVLSHAENLSEEKLAETIALLREHNATAEIVSTPLAEINGKQILSAMEHTATLEEELKKLMEETHHHDDEHEHHHHHHHDHDDDDECDDPECSCHHHDDDEEHEHHHHHHHDHDDDDECDDPECSCHHHHDDDEHEHHHHHHHDHDADEVFTSWGRETARKFTEKEIGEILQKLDSDAKYGTILRAKGIVAGDGYWIHFDYIPGGIDVRRGTAETIGRLCVIGCDLNEAAVAELFGI
ncbi:MAG: GTP-binding protein [Clostridia bacterium]|nr:GTP-binding protein [Clostridia bacterium]